MGSRHPALDVIRDVPDFPKPGILFKDLTPLFGDPVAFGRAMDDLAALVDWSGITHVAGIEARGFILAAHWAAQRGLGFIPIRKPGKLPADTISATYELEYGTDTLEIHADACAGAGRVLVVDDLLATGGTAEAGCELVRRAGGDVAGLAVLVELTFLRGRERLGSTPLTALLCLDGD